MGEMSPPQYPSQQTIENENSLGQHAKLIAELFSRVRRLEAAHGLDSQGMQ